MKAKLKELHTVEKIFWYLVFFILLSVFSYFYFVNKIVYNVAERQKTETAITKLTSKISELEFKYISMRNKINPEYAYAIGFTDVKNQRYITKKSDTGELSLHTD